MQYIAKHVTLLKWRMTEQHEEGALIAKHTGADLTMVVLMKLQRYQPLTNIKTLVTIKRIEISVEATSHMSLEPVAVSLK